MNRKYKDRYVTTMPFERDVFFYLKENLPKGTDLADEINMFLKEKMEFMQKEKNLNSPNYSAIGNIDSDITNESQINKHNETLDLYLLSQSEINKKLDTISDKQTLIDIKVKAENIVNITRTSIKNILEDEKKILR